MSEILFRYQQVNPTTWAYLSALLTIALFFKFSRFWSVRNLDLILLVQLAPGLLLVKYGMDHPSASNAALVEQIGYIWLFVTSGLLLLRLLLDASMIRRPLLEANLSVGGLVFLGASLFVFLMANVITGLPGATDIAASRRAADLRSMEASPTELNTLKTHGPGFPLVFLLPHISTQRILRETNQPPAADTAPIVRPTRTVHAVTARVVAILSHLMIVTGMILVGWLHFDNARTGIAAATLYLLLPYTALWTGSVTHALPGALIVWAIVAYRRPLIAGSMIGLAFGTIYYPLFLLPLWLSFYWRRGLVRFLGGVIGVVLLMVMTLALTSTDLTMFLARVQQMFGIRFPIGENLNGIWQYWNDVYRYPIVAAFLALSVSFAIWPAHKNLGTLLSCSAALMVGTQFWHAHSGGLALAWYLPLLLLTIFRPNLEDRVALAVLGNGWLNWGRRTQSIRAA